METKTMTYMQALRLAMDEELARDDKVILLGQDVGILGGAYGVTGDLYHKYGPDRIIDSPLAENAIVGFGIGAAMMGWRPIMEIMKMDFSMVAVAPIVNHLAKYRFMSGGQIEKMPAVVRTAIGGGTRSGPHHSYSLHHIFAGFPGLKLVCASTPEDAKGLLKSAIRDDDPVVFLEHKLLYAHKEEIADGEYTIPLGAADVKRAGRDLTIITWSREVHFALEAAQTLEAEGIDVEVLDLRTLVPLDWDAIVKSVSKTHNVIIVSEEVKRGSYAGELSAQIAEELFDELDAPVERVCGLNICSPFSPVLEDKNFPHPEDIVRAVKRVLNK